MRTKDEDLLQEIQDYIEEYCDTNGRGPAVSEIADAVGKGKSLVFYYLAELVEQERISRTRHGYVSNEMANTEQSMRSVAILGAVPCGPLTEVEEYIEGYVRLPESFVGKGKFYLLKASGNSMIRAGINDGDLVLIRQQQTANIGDIVVALVDNEVTLKRLQFDDERKSYYLHPENGRMRDIYVDELQVQGVAVKVIKDL